MNYISCILNIFPIHNNKCRTSHHNNISLKCKSYTSYTWSKHHNPTPCWIEVFITIVGEIGEHRKQRWTNAPGPQERETLHISINFKTINFKTLGIWFTFEYGKNPRKRGFELYCFLFCFLVLFYFDGYMNDNTGSC